MNLVKLTYNLYFVVGMFSMTTLQLHHQPVVMFHSKFSAALRPPWQMLTWGTLSRAVYLAESEDPKNAKVIKSVTVGLRNVT